MKTITTSQGEFVFIPVPNDAKKFRIVNFNRSGLYLKQVDSKVLNGFDFKLPKGNYKIIGICSQIIKDEELAKTVVLRKIVFNITTNKSVVKYLDYMDKYNICTKATESFASLLQANDIWLENHLGEKPTPCYDVLWDEEGDEELYNWEQAQAKVQDWFVVKRV